ncbi:MAG: hypothetical protein ACKVOW_07660 [Chitinophagaceae bacterium]
MMQIHTTIKAFVPVSIVNEFRNNLAEKGIKSSVEIDEGEWSNFSGDEIADIIVFIKEHKTELIVAGLLVPITYDVLKFAIASMWKALKKAIFKTEDKEEFQKKHISLRVQDADGKLVNLEIEGNIPEGQIEVILDKAFRYLDKDKKEDLFTNTDFVNSINNQRSVQLIYNAETDMWEPVNYTELRKQWDDLMRKIDELDS